MKDKYLHNGSFWNHKHLFYYDVTLIKQYYLNPDTYINLDF